jgi:hypothetical protein
VAAYNKFYLFVQALGLARVNLSSDTLKLMLTNTLPVATNAVYGDISANELTNGNGYTTGGGTLTGTSWTNAGVTGSKLVAANFVWTATGSMGPFRWAVLYDNTPATKDLVGFWDRGAALTLASGDTFEVDFDPTNGVLTLT